MKDLVYKNYTQKEALEYTAKMVDFGVALTVYSSLNELLNAYILLRQDQCFKHAVKQRANHAIRMHDKKLHEIANTMLHKGFAESYWDSVIDACSDDMEVLRAELKRTLESYGVEKAKLYAQMETARILLYSAAEQYTEVVRDCTNLYRTMNLSEMRNLDLCRAFREFHVEAIFQEWNAVCEMVYISKHPMVDLNSKRIRDAFKPMAEKFARGEYMDNCLAVAAREYPEYSNTEIIRED